MAIELFPALSDVNPKWVVGWTQQLVAAKKDSPKTSSTGNIKGSKYSSPAKTESDAKVYKNFFETPPGESIILGGKREGEKFSGVIEGLEFPYDLDASNCYFDRSVHFKGCTFHRHVNFNDAYVQGSLIFEDCVFADPHLNDRTSTGGQSDSEPAGTEIGKNQDTSEPPHKLREAHSLEFKRVKVDGRLNMRGSQAEHRNLVLNGATIGAGLRLGASEDKIKIEIGERSRFRSIEATDIRIEESADLGGLQCTESIRFIRANVSGAFFLTHRFQDMSPFNIELQHDEAHILPDPFIQNQIGPPKVDNAQLQFDHSLTLLKKLATTAKSVDFSGAKISGDISARGLQCTEEFRITGATILGNVTLRPWHPCERSETGSEYHASDDVRKEASYATYRSLPALRTKLGSFRAENSEFLILRLTGCHVTGYKLHDVNLREQSIEISGDVDLRGVKCRAVKISVWKPINWRSSWNEPNSPSALSVETHLESPAKLECSNHLDRNQTFPLNSRFQGTCNVSDATIDGPFTMQGVQIDKGLLASNVKISGECSVTRWSAHENAKSQPTVFRATIGSSPLGDRECSLDFRNATFGGNITFDGVFCKSGLDLFSTKVRGSITIDPGLKPYADTSLTYESAVIGMGRDGFGRKFSIRFTSGEVNGNFVARAIFCESAIIFESSTIAGELDLGPFRYKDSFAGSSNIGVGAWSPQSLPVGEYIPTISLLPKNNNQVQLRTYSDTFPPGIAISDLYTATTADTGSRVEPVTTVALNSTVDYATPADNWNRWVSIFAEGLTVGGPASFDGITCLSCFRGAGAHFRSNLSISAVLDQNRKVTVPVIYGGVSAAGRPYSLQLGNANVGGSLMLNGCILTAGLYLNRAKILGNLEAVAVEGFTAAESQISNRHYPTFIAWKPTDSTEVKVCACRLFGTEIRGMLEFRDVHLIGGMHCENIQVGQSVHIENVRVPSDKDKNIIWSAFKLKGEDISTGIRQNGDSYFLVLLGARIKSDLRISHSGRPLPDLDKADRTKKFDVLMDDAKIEGTVEFKSNLFDEISSFQARCEKLLVRGHISDAFLRHQKPELACPVRASPFVLWLLIPLLRLVFPFDGIQVVALVIATMLFGYLPFVLAMKLSRGFRVHDTKGLLPVDIRFSEFFVNLDGPDNVERLQSYKFARNVAVGVAVYFATPVLFEFWDSSTAWFIVLALLIYVSIASYNQQRRAKEVSSDRLKELSKFLRCFTVPTMFYRRLIKIASEEGENEKFKMLVLSETPNSISSDQRLQNQFASWFLHVTVGNGLRLTPLVTMLALLLLLSAALFARPESVVRKDHHYRITELANLHQLATLGAAASVDNPLTATDSKFISGEMYGFWFDSAGLFRGQRAEIVRWRLSRWSDLGSDQYDESYRVAEDWLKDYTTPDSPSQRELKLSHEDGLGKLDWRQRFSLGLTLRYFVPFAEFAPGMDWEASPRAIKAPRIVANCPLYHWMIVDRPGKAGDAANVDAITYQDLAMILTVLGWLTLPLLIGSLTGLLRTKSQKLESD